MDNSSDELVAHNSLYGNIWNVFRYQNSCYVVAGSDQKIYRWNLSSHTWHPVTGIPTELRDGCGFSLVASDDRIYMLGGWLNEQAVNRAYVYDMGSDKWQSLPKIPFAGYLCSSVIINNTLYVAGGVTLDSSGKVHSVYEVSALPLTDSCWRRSTRMSYGSATLTVLYDRLIATGGISIDGYAVNKVETFDATSDRWLPVPDMITPRYGHGICVTENNTLAEVGGVEATECVSDSQSLDCEFLVRENLQLKGEMETWRNVQEVLLRENSLLKEKVKALEEEMQMNPVCQLKETAEHLERSSKNEAAEDVENTTV